MAAKLNTYLLSGQWAELWRALALCSSALPIIYLYTWKRFSWAFSGLNSPSSFSLSWDERDSSPGTMLVSLGLIYSKKSVSFLHWGAQKCTQHLTCGLAEAERRERFTSLDFLFWWKQDFSFSYENYMSLPEILALKIHIVVAVAETDFFFFLKPFIGL